MNREGNSSRMGFLLAGGKSSRMGVDKAFLKFDGRSLLERGVEALHRVCPVVAIVGEASKFSNCGVAVVEDIYRNCGPLGGIHAALTHAPAELNLMLAVDMPYVSPDLLDFLLTSAEGCNALVTVPRVRGGYQPLCAVYRRAFGDAAEEALKAGENKIDALFASVSVRIIGEDELRSLGVPDRMFFNLNTLDDLRTPPSAPFAG